MKYIKLINGVPTNYTIEQLLTDDPGATIYRKTKMPNEQLLAEYNVFPLITQAVPELAEDETAEEGTPVFENDEWIQTWNVRKLTEEEVAEVIENYSLDSVALDETNILASSEVQKARYDICKACDSFTIFKTCQECNCIMPIKIKINSVVCPLDKW